MPSHEAFWAGRLKMHNLFSISDVNDPKLKLGAWVGGPKGRKGFVD